MHERRKNNKHPSIICIHNQNRKSFTLLYASCEWLSLMVWWLSSSRLVGRVFALAVTMVNSCVCLRLRRLFDLLCKQRTIWSGEQTFYGDLHSMRWSCELRFMSLRQYFLILRITFSFSFIALGIFFFRCHKVNHSPHSHFIRISDTLRSAFNDNFVCCGNMTCRWGGKEPKSSSDKLESSPHLINSLWRCAATSTAIRHNSMPFTTQGRPIINQQ